MRGSSACAPPPPHSPESDGPGNGVPTTRDRHPLGKALSGWGSPATAIPSGRSRGCQPRSPREPGFRTVRGGSHTGSLQGFPGVRVARCSASVPPDRQPAPHCERPQPSCSTRTLQAGRGGATPRVLGRQLPPPPPQKGPSANS